MGSFSISYETDESVINLCASYGKMDEWFKRKMLVHSVLVESWCVSPDVNCFYFQTSKGKDTWIYGKSDLKKTIKETISNGFLVGMAYNVANMTCAFA